MTQNDIFRTKKAVAGSNEDRNERARQAVKAFRAMQPGLSGYARAITGRKSVSVELAEGIPRTDGTKIFFKPPIALGDNTPHERAKCDRRDPSSLMQLCPACRVREEVLITIYHEIAHIVFGTFAEVSATTQAEALERAVEEVGPKWATHMREQWKNVPAWKKNDVMNLATLVSPYLPILVNALEDARVDNGMFKARKGTKVMFDAYVKSIFDSGVEDDDGTFVKWEDKPADSQILIGVFVLACGYEYKGWFHPQVEAALADKRLGELCHRINTVRSAEGSFSLAFPILARLRELGFCKRPEDPEDEEQQDEDEGDGDSGEGSGSSQDESSEEQSEDGSEGAEDSGDDSAESGQSDGDGGGDSEVQQPSDGSSGSPDGDESESSDTDPSEEPDEGDVRDGSGDSTRDDASSEGSDPESGSSSDDGLGESGAEAEAEQADDGDETVPDDGRNSAGEGSEDSSQGNEANGDSEPVEGEAVDEADTESDPSGDAEADSGGEDHQGEGEDTDPSRGADGESDGDFDDAEGDDEPADTGDAHDDEATEEDYVDPVDSGADEGKGGDVIDDCGQGSPDEAESDLKVFGQHEVISGAASSGDSPEDEAAIDKAIIQSQYFEKPSANVYGVREYLWKNRDDEKPAAWADHSMRYGYQTGQEADVTVGEDVLGPALLEMRRAFTDNQRADYQRGLKSGRVNERVLGKRAWHGDPRLFQKKRVPGKRSYAVVIGIDISGSTVGRNIVLAKRAAKAQAELCSRLGVDFAVYAHTANPKDSSSWNWNELMLDMYVIKSFTDPWDDKVQEAFNKIGPDAENLDGHGVEYYRKVVERHSATDKIILYYSDGKMPAANHDEELEILQREINYCRGKGITLLGVGIRTDSPARHGLDTVQVDADEDIPKVVRHLQTALLRRR